MRIIQFCLQNPLFLNLLTAFVIFVGLSKTLEMNKEAFPAINFDVVAIRTIYPGATPKEVELYVTDPIEDELQSVDGLEKVTSASIEGSSAILVYLDPDRSEDDKIKTVNDIQRAVDRVRDLPDELPHPPEVRDVNSGDMPVLEVALSSAVSYETLHHHADQLKDLLEEIDDVQDVILTGYREKEFWVEVQPKNLNRYNMGLENIMGRLASRNVNLPGGVLKTAEGDSIVRTVGELQTSEALESIVLRSNDAGIAVRLGDVAAVKATFEEERAIFRTDQKPSINLLVNKKASGDIISAVDQVKAVTDDYLKRLPDEPIQAAYINDISFFVRNRLEVLLNNAVVGIILVLVSLLLFLSRGIALVTAVGMPVAFLGTFMVMGYMDMTINLISMFGLVIVLGMLVDDAIIVAENIWQYYEAGESPWNATVKGASEVFWPVTATILTTIAAFSPLMMVEGIFGKFIKILPEVVIMALAMSLLEAMFILPSHAYDILRFSDRHHRKRQQKDKHAKRVRDGVILNRILAGYGQLLWGTLKLRYLFLTLLLASLLGAVWFAKNRMPLILFPADGVEAFFLRAELPRKTSLETTAKKFEVLEELVHQLPDNELKNYVTHIGIQRDDPNDPFTKRSSNVGQIVVFLTAEKARKRTADDIIEYVRGLIKELPADSGFQNVYFSRARTGPPVGKPVAIRLKGDSLEDLAKAADLVVAKLQTMAGVRDVASNFNLGKDEYQIEIDEQKAAQSLLTVRDVALHVRTAIAGQIATYVRDEGDRIAVRVRYPEEDRREITSLMNSRIANAAGYLVPLNRVAAVKQTPGLDAIFHRNFRRTVTVSAAVDESSTSSTEVNLAVLPYLKELRGQYPDLLLEAGGEYEDTEESLNSLVEAFAVALGLIYLILATLFRSLTLPFIVMAAIPFGIIGVVISFNFHDLPLSFIGLVGAIGLAGVVVNDSIVLVDFIRNARLRGMKATEAAVYAGKRRFRAVWLTTLTTALGLLPLVYSIGGEDKFLRPAATALAYGLVFATILILLFIPAIYVIHEDIKRLFLWPWRGGLESGPIDHLENSPPPVK